MRTAENRFLAASGGIRARLIEEHSQERRPVRDVLELRSPDGLACSAELAAAARLAADPGYVNAEPWREPVSPRCRHCSWTSSAANPAPVHA